MMLIDNAILSLLNTKQLSGYDLKKIMVESEYMPWSGNNNQIYKALTQLAGMDFVIGETIHQEGMPSKKVYHITEKGRIALSDWIETVHPEMPEFRKPFLVQLSCAVRTSPASSERLLKEYLEELTAQRMMQMEMHSRKQNQIERTRLEKWLDREMNDNLDAFYRTEIEWAQRLLDRIRETEGGEGFI